MMELYVVARNVKPYATTRLEAVVGCRLIESLEHVGFVAVGNALACIRNSNGRTVLPTAERQ